MFCVVKDPPHTGNITMIGCQNANSSRQYIRRTTANIQTTINGSTAVNNTNIVTSGNIYFATRRVASGLAYADINASEMSGSSTSGALSDVGCLELTRSDGTSGGQPAPVGEYDTSYHLISGHGSGDIDQSALRTTIINTLTALGL
jgi:hypothetical protein